jgi:hypothetical protein
MRVLFTRRENGPERLVSEAELVFDERSPLKGLKLVGFSVWEGADGEPYVTFPSRAFGAGAERRYFDYLRSANGSADPVKRVKAWIVEEYRRQTERPASSRNDGHRARETRR